MKQTLQRQCVNTYIKVTGVFIDTEATVIIFAGSTIVKQDLM